MGRHADDDAGRADDRHDPSIDRDDFSHIEAALPTAEQIAEAERLYAAHDPAEWSGRLDDSTDGA